MAVPATAVYVGGIACTPDGAVYVEPTGTASITGGTINAIDVTSITSGTYTPTLSNTTNIATSSAGLWQYIRIGNVVTASGRVQIDPTAGSVDTLLGISLPVASNFTANSNCAGAGACGSIASYSAAVLADTVNDRASLAFVCGADHADRSWFVTFTYAVM
jgi:hypothetical protein